MKKTFRQLLFVIGAVVLAGFALTACGPNEPVPPPDNGTDTTGTNPGTVEVAEYEFSSGVLVAALDAEQGVYQYIIILVDKKNAANNIGLAMVGRGYSPKYTPVAATYPVLSSQNGMVTITSVISDESLVTIDGGEYAISGGSIVIKETNGNFSLEGTITYGNDKEAELSCDLSTFANLPYGDEVSSLSSNVNAPMESAKADLLVVAGGAIVSLDLYNGTSEDPTAIFYTVFGISANAVETNNIDGIYPVRFAPKGYDVVEGVANASIGMTLTQDGKTIANPSYYMDKEKAAFLTEGQITITTVGGVTSVTCDATSFTGKRVQVSYSGTVDVTVAQQSAAPKKIAAEKVPMLKDKVSLR